VKLCKSQFCRCLGRVPSSTDRSMEAIRYSPSCIPTRSAPESPLAQSYSPSFSSTESLSYIYSAERQPEHRSSPAGLSVRPRPSTTLAWQAPSRSCRYSTPNRAPLVALEPGLPYCIQSPSTAAPSRSFRLGLQYAIHRPTYYSPFHQLANEPLDEPAGLAGVDDDNQLKPQSFRTGAVGGACQVQNLDAGKHPPTARDGTRFTYRSTSSACSAHSTKP
jgi:hypothetical protein